MVHDRQPHDIQPSARGDARGAVFMAAVGKQGVPEQP